MQHARSPFLLPLAKIQPSQLYISSEKLARVQAWWQPARLESLTPIPIKCLGGRLVATDGHTRAYVAYRLGFTEIPAIWDEDALDWDAYHICVDWCLAEGIHSVMNLGGRVIPPAAYARLWLGRCRGMQGELAKRRRLR